MYNVAISHGGAVCLINGTIIVGAESSVVFTYNVALADESLQLSYDYIDWQHWWSSSTRKWKVDH